jgi:hemerythrin HHE cation binding domain-containing protein
MRPDETVLPSELRRALLAEHVRIGNLLDETEDLADRIRNGDDRSGERLMIVAGRLRRLLEDHNRSEEEVLEPVLRADDPGGGRVDEMLAEHTREHAELLAMLEEVDPAALAGRIPTLAEAMRAHMAREERGFLSAPVLRDDAGAG